MGNFHQQSDEHAQDRLALVGPGLAQVPAQDFDGALETAGLGRQVLELSQHALVGGRQAERGFQQRCRLFWRVQVVPGDLGRGQQMTDLLRRVLGDARVPCPSRQGLGHTRGIATPMQQLDQCLPGGRRRGTAGIALDAGREPA